MHDNIVRDWLERIRAEYRESPGMRLTPAQARRLWGLDAAACESLLTKLVEAKYLHHTRDDAYVRAS